MDLIKLKKKKNKLTIIRITSDLSFAGRPRLFSTTASESDI